MEDKLLQLVRKGLDIISDEVVPNLAVSDEEWKEIFRLSREQAVVGACLCAIEKLPEECRPPKPILLQWIAATEQVKRQNAKVNGALAELIGELRGYGIEPVVVKGQAIAQEYERPELRMSGDIDVFIAPSQWQKVEKWIEAKGFKATSHSAEKHIEVCYNGVSVELHYHLNTFSTAKANRHWTGNIEKKAIENSRTVGIKPPSSALVVNKDTCHVRTLGLTETLLHLTIHVHHHLLTEGVGLRQLIDTTLFLNNHFGDIDFDKLKRHLHGIGHYKAFTAYCALMNKYLGLPKERIPCELDLEDYVYADKIMREVWRGGNFGHKNNLNGVKPGLLHSLNTATLVLRHSLQFHRLAPAESRGYWWNKIFWRMKRK